MKHLRASSSTSSVEYGDIVRLWIARILMPLGGYKEFITELGYSDDHVARELGLPNPLDSGDDDFLNEFDQKDALKKLRTCYRSFQKKSDTCAIPEVLEKNIRNLSKILLLSEVDQQILAFAVLLYVEESLSEAANTLGNMTFNKICKCLSDILELPLDEVKETLGNQGKLASTSIVYVDHECSGYLRGKLEIISRDFAERMLMPASDPIQLLRETILPCTSAELCIDDYSHIESSLKILIPYLQQSINNHIKGVNILIYGPPGTGKSQLSRVIAQNLGIDIYEVSRENNDGDPIDGTRRLRALRTAQNIFESGQHILLFDEVEDIFGDGSSLFGVKSTASKHKGWINRTLEESPIPTIWLTNNVNCMDPAFIRRFDLVVKLDVPQRSQRKSIIEKLCGDLASEATLEHLSQSDELSPAVIASASRVIRAIHGSAPSDTSQKALKHVIESTLTAQGHRALSNIKSEELPEHYDPEVINCAVDLTMLADNLAGIKSGRLCIYGPPGTGKTAYARWLATKLDIPLHVKRASDLLSMFVGGTEENIAEAFHQAEEDNALLLIDEVDSFLQDRRKAQRSWEVSAVNEMLTQMETFSGIFIASTNLVDDLDQASLRRFDIKAKFDYLRPEQAWSLFTRVSSKIGLTPSNEAKELISQLGVLTPGDYNVIDRRHRFQPFGSATEVARVLVEECAMKEDGKPKRSIGFIQNTTHRNNT
jgi:transitional endoplasmic reticulum ATPase